MSSQWIPSLGAPTIGLSLATGQADLVADDRSVMSESIYSPELVPVSDTYVPPAHASAVDWDFYPANDTAALMRLMAIDKSNDKAFHDKLKHFFVLLSAGKPIYSMNGLDDVIMGYMGLVTTIVATFQENMKEEFYSVADSDVRVVVLNRDPVLFMAVSKIVHEDDATLLRQLHTMHRYLLSILSKPTIDKNFRNRMNYDLRKVLSPMDFHNFDVLCLKLTYGIYPTDDEVFAGFDFFMSQLLGSCLQSVKITNTSRNKLNHALLLGKRLRPQSEGLIFQGILPSAEETGADLLFSFLTMGTSLLAHMRPKNHLLTNDDIDTLLLMIELVTTRPDHDPADDLWIPLCMPTFNPNGFLYVLVKQFDLADYVAVDGLNIPPQLITILLLSGSKSAFFNMQKVAHHIIHKVVHSQSLRGRLARELVLANRLSILSETEVLVISHFVYKLKVHNQFIMSDPKRYGPQTSDTILQLIHFYLVLHNTKSSISHNGKKLTYTKWTCTQATVTGFMLTDKDSEFYCVCQDVVPSQQVIDHSLRVIQWCEKYHKRLFSRGVSF